MCFWLSKEQGSLFLITTVDGSEIPHNHLGCTKKPLSNGIFTISTGAGFLPSTVLLVSKIQSIKLLMHHMDVSENSGFSPQIIHFNRVFHYKPSILGAHPYFWKHPHVLFLAIILCILLLVSGPGHFWYRASVWEDSIIETNLGELWGYFFTDEKPWYITIKSPFGTIKSPFMGDFFRICFRASKSKSCKIQANLKWVHLLH